jgi:hypothetical protein
VEAPGVLAWFPPSPDILPHSRTGRVIVLSATKLCIAEQTVYHDTHPPSAIVLPVLEHAD